MIAMSSSLGSGLCSLLALALLILPCQAAVNGSDHINIWIVTHTHDDVGWLETVDQYYISEVQWILDTAIQCLVENPDRRFTYVEMAFFYRWWNEQTPDAQKAVASLVKSGQLEFNLAGWCMNDEATTSFFSVINQMTEGALFLQDNVGPSAYPTVGWHVDPFGHSSVTPSLWANMGFDAFGINRIDYRVKDQRKSDKELEFVWRGSRSLGKESEIFTHIMDSHYCTPQECSFDKDMFIQTDPLLPTYPLTFTSQGEAFVNMARTRNQWYRHDHILIPFGCDFGHQNAFKSFEQMDKLIAYVNGNTTLNATVRYGTFGEYIKAINALNITWPVYHGDFFPYASAQSDYWTGFYTSRPLLKGYVRSRAALLRHAEFLLYLVMHSKDTSTSAFDQKTALQQVGFLRRAMGVTQHHDSVSGTEKQFVMEDYYLQLYKGTVACTELAATSLSLLLKGDCETGPTLHQNSSEVMQNITAAEEVAVVIFNSLAWERVAVISVPTNLTNLVVYDAAQQVVKSQLLLIPSYNTDMANKSTHELVFSAKLPAFGFDTFFLRQGGNSQVSEFVRVNEAEDISVENDELQVGFSAATHRLSKLTIKGSAKTIAIDNNLVQYMAGGGNSEGGSNCYTFRPMQDNRVHIGAQSKSQFKAVGWSFYQPYNSPGYPVILVTAASEPNKTFTDTLTVSTSQTDNHQTSFHMRKVDGSWRQDLWLNYAILTENQPPLNQLSGCQSGSHQVASSMSSCKTEEITFETAFSSPAQIITTVESRGNGNDDAFAVSVVSTTSTGVSVNVCRADGSQHGWNKPVFINFLAYDSETKTSDLAKVGSFNFSTSNAHQPQQIKVSLSDYQVFQPMVLATAMSKSGKVYAVTSFNATASGFGVNVHSLDGKPWADTITVTWLVFQRATVEAVVAADNSISVSHTEGPVVAEVRQVFKEHYAVTTRLYQGSTPFVEQVYDIGPMDFRSELVTRFDTNLSNPLWYSDDTGLELIPRRYEPSKDEIVAGNYYPTVMGVYMNDTDDARSLAVLSDRSHGSASLKNGNLEIMLHRRLFEQNFGEVLNETDHIRARLWLLPADNASNAYARRHKLTFELQNPPLVMYGKAPAGGWSKSFTTSFSAMTSSGLPENIHLLSLKARNSTTGQISNFVARFQHVFERDDSSPLSEPVSIDLGSYFEAGYKPIIADELTLSANRDRSDVQRMHWQTEPDQVASDTDAKGKILREIWTPEDGDTVQLAPRQIRTFLTK